MAKRTGEQNRGALEKARARKKYNRAHRPPRTAPHLTEKEQQEISRQALGEFLRHTSGGYWQWSDGYYPGSY